MASLKDFNDNQETAEERKGQLGEGMSAEERQDIPVELKDQIPVKLREVLEERDIGLQIRDRWNNGNALREEQLERQRKLLVEIDEFVEPIYRAPQEWMSDLHIPMSFIICKTFHARMFSAIMGGDPPFQVKAQKEANTERSPMIQDLMNYTIKRWANRYRGIDDTIDDWLWAWVTTGRGIIKQRWIKEYTRFVDVEEVPTEGPGRVIDGQFTPTVELKQQPIKKDELIYEGPVFEHVFDEDI